jgi:TrmH family RNA methyltransferase
VPPFFEINRVAIVLVNTRNPLNIGAAARAMSNFGFFDLRVVNPYEASFREARSAVGAAEVLTAAREFPSVGEAVADCVLVVGTTAATRRELQHPMCRLDQGAPLIRKHLRRGRAAILFGSEKRGLSNEDLSHCHWLLRIPTREEHKSMNLGQAVAVCVYELARQMTKPQPPRPLAVKAGAKPQRRGKTTKVEMNTPANAKDLERITLLLLEALRLSSYIPAAAEPGRSALADEKIRRMVRRLNLSTADAETWLGMLRQMIWKMGAGSPTSP